MMRRWMVVLLTSLAVTGCGRDSQEPQTAARQAAAALSQVDAGPPSHYLYDEGGRLIAVYDPAGGSARYFYDEGGNLLEVARNAAGELAIHDFSPKRGLAGSEVVLSGSGFGDIPGTSTVSLNGVSAPVVSASERRLVVLVPSGASSGTWSVSVGTATAVSREEFVVGETGPVITGFAPAVGNVGTVLTVTGTGFEPVATMNVVAVGTGPGMTPSVASANDLTATIRTMHSGRVRVSTPAGTAQSEGEFYVSPSGTDAGAVVSTGRVEVDGAPVEILIPQGGKAALLVFAAQGCVPKNV